MRSPSLCTAALALLLSAAALAKVSAQIPPPPPRFVYDGAHVLSAQQRSDLEDRVLQIDRETGVQIAVATFSSLDGDTPEDATMRIAEAWKPGHQGKDDGIVLAAYMAERKIRVEVGYGLEDKVPDAVASRIVRDQIAPYFRQGDVAGGLMAGVDALSASATGKVLPRPAGAPAFPSGRGQDARAGSPLFGCFCMMFFLAMFLSSLFRARRPRHFRRGYYTAGMPWWAWFFLGSTLNQRRPGGFGTPQPPRGGGWGGGGFGGGGGHFGGGSFGGGGATGGW